MPSQQQSAKSHTALDPLSHFIMMPLALISLIVATTILLRTWPHQRLDHLWMSLVSLLLILATIKMRVYSLRVQDRVIMLEERTRLAGHPAAATLTQAQLIALRFAPDAELASLAYRAAEQHLTPAQIKQAIQTWRPDPHRI